MSTAAAKARSTLLVGSGRRVVAESGRSWMSFIGCSGAGELGVGCPMAEAWKDAGVAARKCRVAKITWTIVGAREFVARTQWLAACAGAWAGACPGPAGADV